MRDMGKGELDEIPRAAKGSKDYWFNPLTLTFYFCISINPAASCELGCV